MSDFEPHRTIQPIELGVLLNLELAKKDDNEQRELIQNMLDSSPNQELVSDYRELLDDPESYRDIRWMAVVHSSPFRDLCIQYHKEKKLAHVPIVHDLGNIMVSYFKLFKIS